MRKFSLCAIGLGLLLMVSPKLAKAQIGDGTLPVSWQENLTKANVPTHVLPPFDVQAMIEEDARIEQTGVPLPYRFGREFDVNLSTNNSGEWQVMKDGSRVWRLDFFSPGAKTLNFILDRFLIPDGAALYVYNADRSHRVGGITNINQTPTLELGIQPIRGERVTLEYVEPAGVAFPGEIRVRQAIHGYKSIFEISAFGQSGACNINVNCPIGQPWEKQKRSVAMLVQGSAFCTGSMMNNVNNDGRPFLLTANHCTPANGNVANWVFVFNWESQDCANPPVAPPTNQSVAGAVIRARFATTDFALLELNNRPPASYRVYMNGWNRAKARVPSGFSIHHPSGDIKKFTPFTTSTVPATYGGGGQVWRVVWSQGTTEGGSSGSPLYDNNGLVIGQLWGGGASCTNLTAPDNYGRLSGSWDTAGTAPTRMVDWLDPNRETPEQYPGIEATCATAATGLPLQQNFDAQNTLPTNWQVNNQGGNRNWSVARNISAYGVGVNCMAIDNFSPGPAGAVHNLTIPALKATRLFNMKLKFDIAYRVRGNFSDTLAIRASTDCGVTFTTIWKKGGADLASVAGNPNDVFSPTATDWKTDSLDIPTTLDGKDFLQFSFSNISGGGNLIYLDNVNLTGAQRGLPPQASFSPAGSVLTCPGLPVQFTNTSRNEPTSFEWRFVGGTPLFSNEANPVVTYTAPGTYDVFLKVTNAEGADSLARTGFVTVTDIPLGNLPMREDFEATTFPPAGWTVRRSGADSTWRRAGRVFNRNPNIDQTLPFGTAYLNNYPTNNRGRRDFLITPKLDLTTLPDAKVIIDYAYTLYAAANADSLAILYSTNCGQTFERLWQRGGADLSTTTPVIQTAFLVPTLAQFKRQIIQLPANIANQQNIQFAIVNIGGFGQPIYINNFLVDTITVFCPTATNARTLGGPTYCPGDNVIIEVDEVANVSYNWTGPSGFTSSQRRDTIFSITAAAAGTYNVVLTSNTGCASSPASVTIAVGAALPQPTVVNRGDTLSSSVAATSYQWFRNNVAISGATSRDFRAVVFGTYVVEVTSADGCKTRSAPRQFTPTGLEVATLAQQANIYPNPNNGAFTLQLDNIPSGTIHVTLTDAIGRIVHRFNVENDGATVARQVSLPTQLKGLYFARISGEKFNKTIPVEVIR